MHYFCTYFDHRFLPRALALVESLRKWCPDFHLWALCMDDAGFEAVQRLSVPEITPIRLADFEQDDPELLRAKSNRTAVEYYYTCSPSLPLYVFRHFPEVDLLTYLDADLYFYSDPTPLFEELGSASIGLIPHRFSPRVRDRIEFGIYNVGWLSFRRDPSALACLQWWRERCLEWCYARSEGDRYADQKYLDQFPGRFAGVRVIEHKGANVGPWNLANYYFREQNGLVWVDEQPLIFFHFSSLLRVAGWLYNTNLASWHVRPLPLVRRKVLGPYIAALERARMMPGLPGPASPTAPPPGAAETHLEKLQRKLRSAGRILRGLLVQDHLLVVRSRVL